MKKIITILTVLSLLLTAGLTAMAENDAAPAACPAGCTKANFVDANGDGVCDSFVDADNDGVCDGCGLRQGNQGQRGANFTDADGDGVCDLRAQRQANGGRRQGARVQQGNRNGVGSNGHGMNRRGR